MANLPEKNIVTVSKVTSIPSNTNVFINANGEFVQANIDDVVSAGNQFKVFNGNLILAKGTSEGYATDFGTYGNSTQDGEPTPDAPIEILSNGHRGYNDGEYVQGNYSTSTGVLGSNTQAIASVNEKPCKAGDEITITYEDVVAQLSLVFYSDDGFIELKSAMNTNTLTVTAPNNATKFQFDVRVGTPVTPATAKHICVTINGMYALIVKNGNKNLWEFGDQTFTRMVLKPVFLKAGTYTFSATVTSSDTDHSLSRVFFFDKDGAIIKYDNLKRNVRNFITVELDRDAVDVRLYASYYDAISAGDTATYSNIQLELGDTMTEFVEHEEQTTYIPIAEPLRGIGEVKDSAKKVDSLWNENRKFSKVVFDGSDDEDWTYNVNGGYAYIPISNIKTSNKNVLSTHYKNNGTYGVTSADFGNIWVNNIGQLIIVDNRFTSLAEWKANLQANPIKVVYQLAEETFTPFANQTPFYNMKTFDGGTLISSDAEMEVEVPMSRAGGVASIGWSKGNLAEIEIQTIKTKLAELQTAVVSA